MANADRDLIGDSPFVLAGSPQQLKTLPQTAGIGENGHRGAIPESGIALVLCRHVGK
jgi:hypothetical protein